MVKRQAIGLAPRTGARSTRRPIHNWHVRHRPFEIQPVAVAPVLAGDSLKYAKFEGRVITDPIYTAVAGWWAEYFMFYVPFSACDEYAAIQTYLTSNAEYPVLTGLDVTTEDWSYYNNAGAGNGPNWVRMAMKPIIRHFFRKEGEDWDTYLAGTVPIAGLPTRTWVDFLRASSTLPVSIGSEDYQGRWDAFETLRANNLIDCDFVDYLKMQGVDVPPQLQEARQDKRKPELVRYVRQYTYPSNVVDPSTGALSNACSWVVTERSERRIFAGEPGLLVLVSLVRPKLYRSLQNGSGLSLLRNGRLWSSVVQDDAPQETLVTREVPTGTGPIGATVDYTVDSNALLAKGDQFVRGAGAPVSALPNATVTSTQYPTSAEIDALFTGASRNVTQDGNLMLTLTSRRTFETI